MEASLEVPTATSVRAIPAKLMVDNRIVINNHLARCRGGKISFTHLIGFAMVEALAEMPEMNNVLHRGRRQAERPDARARQRRHRDRPGQAGRHPPAARPVDQGAPRRSTSPGSGRPTRTSCARARGKLTVDDFAGTTISLTNPGTIGTVHSVPRLMQGQGTIIGVGAMDYPAEFAGASEEALNRMGVSKVLTLTSTYDHRIIQGAQSGDFLRIIAPVLLGEDGFYDASSRRCACPYEPVRWVRECRPTPTPRPSSPPASRSSSTPTASRGHLMADTDPLAYRQRKHPDLDVQTHGLTLWDLDRTFPTGGFGGKPRAKLREVLGLLRDSYCRTVGSEYMHLQDPRQRRWLQELESGYATPAARGPAADPAPAQRGRGVRDLPADQVRRPEAVLARGRRVGHRAARRDPVPGRRRAASTRSASAWRTAAA